MKTNRTFIYDNHENFIIMYLITKPSLKLFFINYYSLGIL